nr:PREDICTED: uncharacterized protein LOC106705049 [Latimeria chalumnae]|eukprot:XP_014349036.1 PREDICTED: uncharacterized protein LOC106705049 [Latimeria chalumnae]
MITIRYGLQKYFLQQRHVDIVNDGAFKEANAVLSATLARLKQEGKGDVQHKELLTREDLGKLYRSCDTNTPAGLQQKVFVDLMLHLCNRGRENLRDFTKSQFHVGVDAEGRRYVALKTCHLAKNQKGEVMENTESGPRMYELKGNPNCPVLSFEKYILKLNPSNEAFWQHPKTSLPVDESVWYTEAPIGKNTLGNMMKKISQEYGLSRTYTNHCLRATFEGRRGVLCS